MDCIASISTALVVEAVVEVVGTTVVGTGVGAVVVITTVVVDASVITDFSVVVSGRGFGFPIETNSPLMHTIKLDFFL